MTEDHAAGDELERVEDGIFRQQLHAAMEKALDTLEPAQRDTIRRRYYAGDTLSEIAADYGTTRERVQQVESRGLRALRRPACVKLLRPFIEEMRSCYAWTGTGWASFRHTALPPWSGRRKRPKHLCSVYKSSGSRNGPTCAPCSLSPTRSSTSDSDGHKEAHYEETRADIKREGNP